MLDRRNHGSKPRRGFSRSGPPLPPREPSWPEPTDPMLNTHFLLGPGPDGWAGLPAKQEKPRSVTDPIITLGLGTPLFKACVFSSRLSSTAAAASSVSAFLAMGPETLQNPIFALCAGLGSWALSLRHISNTSGPFGVKAEDLPATMISSLAASVGTQIALGWIIPFFS